MLIDFRHGNAQKLANLLRGQHGPRRRAMGHRVSSPAFPFITLTNGSSSQTFTTSLVNVALDVEVQNTGADLFTFDDTNDAVTINQPGWYDIDVALDCICQGWSVGTEPWETISVIIYETLSGGSPTIIPYGIRVSGVHADMAAGGISVPLDIHLPYEAAGGTKISIKIVVTADGGATPSVILIQNGEGDFNRLTITKK